MVVYRHRPHLDLPCVFVAVLARSIVATIARRSVSRRRFDAALVNALRTLQVFVCRRFDVHFLITINPGSRYCNVVMSSVPARLPSVLVI